MAITVNGTAISDEHIEGMMNQMRQQYKQHMQNQPGPEPQDEQVRKWAMDTIVEQTLLSQQAAVDDTAITVDDIHEFYRHAKETLAQAPLEVAKQEIEKRIRINRLVRKTSEGADPASEADARAFYEGNPQHFERPEQIHAAHIVKHAKSEEELSAARDAITAIEQELKDGAVFEELASRESDCGDNNGDLGTFPRGKMVEEFDTVAFNLEAGSVSGLVETPFGCHLIKLYELLPGGKEPFEKVSASIIQHLSQQKQQSAIADYVKSLRDQATIVDG